ncbi:PAS domain-containing protein [uncultured Flavobacterium sp.]|uniref:PAS domain-containing protein n=1 Tax=uncultured Flavobacterium sp. TaxID=165435 RepID=UPI0030EC8AB7|tara:strand:- start:5230 stop:5745 length:516 start_codon:yes stop_codon:yes gene_type:complete
MLDFKQYDSAFAKHHDSLDIMITPTLSWSFHRESINEVKSIYVDCNKLSLIASSSKWVVNDWDFKNKLKEEVIIVTDTKLEIVFASHNLTKMNGYREEEVMGRSPKMFHGSATNSLTSNEIRKAIQLQEPFEKTVLNYKKNGDTYLCLIKGFPVFNRKGELSHFIAFEKAA